MGGVMTTLINKNTTVPTKHSQIFSTAEDNQTAVTIHVLQGERKRSQDNKSLGQFNLDGIQPAPRGMAQIEVTFDIDADGILHVSAKDKNTGKEQKITIKASSGLNETEIKKMISDAEENSESDRKFEELVKIRNQGDQISHSTKKQLKDIETKITTQDKEQINSSLQKLDESLKGEDKTQIEKNIQEVLKISTKLMQETQKQSESKSSNTEEKSSTNTKENVVDAEFEEVKDKKK